MKLVALARNYITAKRLVSQMGALNDWKQKTRLEHLRDAEISPLLTRRTDAGTFARHYKLFGGFFHGQLIPALISDHRSNPLEILDIGIGGENKFHPQVVQPEPWEIMAIFMASGLLPEITVLDRKEEYVAHFGRAQEIRFNESRFICKSTGRCIEYNYRDVRPYALDVADSLGAVLCDDTERKALWFEIPATLQKHFHARIIDLVLWEPDNNDLNRFSLVVALNVLGYMASPSIIALAVLNLLKATASGGYVLISSDQGKADFLKLPCVQASMGFHLTDFQANIPNERYLLLQKLI